MAAFTKETVQFLSRDGKTQVAGFFYTPTETAPKAVVQLSHGMCEYVCRYEHYFEVLCQAGFAVGGNDHLGHGHTGKPEDYGFMAEENGYRYVLQDLNTMNALAREKYPGVPCFILGHSMGSFYARWYAELYPETIRGLLISGTGGPAAVNSAGKLMASLLAKVKGPRYISKFLVGASLGSYSKRFEDAQKSPNVWLTRDSAVWDKYNDDPMCNFPFTASAYRDMLTAHTHVNSAAWAKSLKKDLPVLLYAGDEDPVGNYGKGVRTVYEMLRQAGMEDVTLKLYPGGRHEMHNEINKDEVFADVIRWLQERLGA